MLMLAPDLEPMIRELVIEIRALRLALDHHSAFVTTVTISKSDPDDAQLLTAIVARVGGAAFSSADLVAHSRVDAELGAALTGITPKRLGKRLAALAGQRISGFVLQRLEGRDEHGRLWAVSPAATYMDTL